MFFSKSAFVAIVTTLLCSGSTQAFAPVSFGGTRAASSSTALCAAEIDSSVIKAEIRAKYKPGGADTEFARRYRHLVNAKVRTVGEAFADFTKELGYTVNPLYKNMVTDMVGTTHLTVVNARFQRDPIWSLGILTATDLLLKNYPEKDVGEKIVSALFKSMKMDEAQVRAEAKSVLDWCNGKSKDDIEAALQGTGDGPIAAVAQKIKGDEWWMYSRFFGIGLVKILDAVGMEMDKDEVYPVIDDWMSNKLGRPSLSACNDSDMFFKVKSKLDMMETLMKEIEIREKKRLAERLEEKAEAALRAVEKEAAMQREIEAEAAANRERVSS